MQNLPKRQPRRPEFLCLRSRRAHGDHDGRTRSWRPEITTDTWRSRQPGEIMTARQGWRARRWWPGEDDGRDDDGEARSVRSWRPRPRSRRTRGDHDGRDHDETPFRGVNLLCPAGPEGPRNRVTGVPPSQGSPIRTPRIARFHARSR